MAGARLVDRLNAAIVKNAKPAMLGKVRLLPDGDGLYLRIGPNGTKSWILRFQRGPRAHRKGYDMGLGPYPLISLADARDRAENARRQLLDGINPVEERKAKRIATRIEQAKAMTFRQCAEAKIRAKSAGWKTDHRRDSAAQWGRSLELYAYPILGDLPVSTVDTALVMRVLEPIWSEKPETASRVRGRIEAVLDWAKVQGLRDGENPARWKGHLSELLPEVAKVAKRQRQAAGRTEHHEALPYADLPNFFARLQAMRGGVASALEFTILTCARTSEVLKADWSELDLAERVWTIPAARMKAGKEHRVPLSDAALAILETRKDQARPFAYEQMAMLTFLRRRIKRGDITVHGFRSTFSDWATEKTDFPSEAREIALAHGVGNKVEAAYRRGDLFEKRRNLANAWAGYCISGAAEPESKAVALEPEGAVLKP